MIKNFKDKFSERLWLGKRVQKFQSFRTQALRRLDILNAAIRIEDLMLNPGNRFESLTGNRQGIYSIRINRKWRICFEWDGQDSKNVAIIDYH
jgi:proteic killer suppression protein